MFIPLYLALILTRTLTLGRTLLSRLFSVFDRDQNKHVDWYELVSGLTVVCGGTAEEKLKLLFGIFDINNSGRISREAAP